MEPLKGSNFGRLLVLLEKSVSSQQAVAEATAKKSGIDHEVEINYIEQSCLAEARVEKLPNPLTLDNVQVLMEPCFIILSYGREWTHGSALLL